jgi:SAM-dependent methyltransferase
MIDFAEPNSPIRGRGTFSARRLATVPPYKGFAHFYDRIMGGAVAPVIKQTFERSRGRYGIRFASAADIGCGSGTFLLHLAKFCYRLYGVDRSAEMLAMARRNTAGTGIRLLRQDLRGLQLPTRVDLITCNFDTLNYLLRIEGLQMAMERARDNLRDGGHFAFDVITGAGEEGRARDFVQRIRLPDATALWRLRTDGNRRMSWVDMHWSSGGARPWREVHVQRWHSLPRLCALLNRCGLSIRGIHDVVSFAPASSQTWWAHFVTCRGRRKNSEANEGAQDAPR